MKPIAAIFVALFGLLAVGCDRTSALEDGVEGQLAPVVSLDKALVLDSIGRIEATVSGPGMDTVRAEMTLSPDRRSFSGRLSVAPGEDRVLTVYVYYIGNRLVGFGRAWLGETQPGEQRTSRIAVNHLNAVPSIVRFYEGDTVVTPGQELILSALVTDSFGEYAQTFEYALFGAPFRVSSRDTTVTVPLDAPARTQIALRVTDSDGNTACDTVLFSVVDLVIGRFCLADNGIPYWSVDTEYPCSSGGENELYAFINGSGTPYTNAGMTGFVRQGFRKDGSPDSASALNYLIAMVSQSAAQTAYLEITVGLTDTLHVTGYAPDSVLVCWGGGYGADVHLRFGRVAGWLRLQALSPQASAVRAMALQFVSAYERAFLEL